MFMPAFDTLKFAKRLREVGVPEPQAEVLVELFAEAMAERLASKDDLAKMENALQRDIKELDAKIEIRTKELEARIAETKVVIVRWMVGLAMAQIGLMTGILFAILRVVPTH